MLLTQLKYDLLMFSRELFYLVFTIVVPPVTYLFMGQLFGEQTYAGNLNYAETYTPSFILVITFTVVFFAFGFDQVMQRTTGVEKRISISPVSKNMLLLSSIIRAIIMTSFGFVLISVIGFLMYDLQLRIWSVLLSYGFHPVECGYAHTCFSYLLFFSTYEQCIGVFYSHFSGRYFHWRLCYAYTTNAKLYTANRRL